MSSTRASALMLGILAAIGASSAMALDRQIAAKKLVLVRRASVEKLVFVSQDGTFLFPAIGSADDPGIGTPGGAFVDVLSSGEPAARLAAPAGAGNPGWKAKNGMVPVHVFKNAAAPAGPSVVKKVVLKQGKVLKVVAKATGLDLAAPAERIAIRITTGTLRSCASFDGASIVRNEANHFEAKNAAAPATADCSDESLLDSSPVACGSSSPTCGGACPTGEGCFPVGQGCLCLPHGSTPCGTPGSPVCGGDCPAGSTCSSFFPDASAGGPVFCDCAGPGTACGNGFAWGGAPLEGFPFQCYPVLCGGAYPTCGGACGDGGTCSPFFVDVGSFSACICAVPATCEVGGSGYVCPPGDVCHVGPGPGFPVCAAP
jgi:hypothetical protein